MPTFVSVSPDDRRLYVACNHGNTLQVLDAGSLDLVKEIPVGTGAYNVEPSADGKLIIVTNKKAQSVSVVDAQGLTEVVKIPTSKPLPHGVAYSPDGRWAFISQESVGSIRAPWMSSISPLAPASPPSPSPGNRPASRFSRLHDPHDDGLASAR
jgi:YVTN family beta-propeller protein